MNEIDETIRYSVEFSKRTMDILRKMAEEDNVSLVTEIESAISGWYRMRHGFRFSDKQKAGLKGQLEECPCQIEGAQNGDCSD